MMAPPPDLAHYYHRSADDNPSIHVETQQSKFLSVCPHGSWLRQVSTQTSTPLPYNSFRIGGDSWLAMHQLLYNVWKEITDFFYGF